MDLSNPKEKSDKLEKQAIDDAPELVKFLKDEEMWQKDLLISLIDHQIKTQDDIQYLSDKDFDDIMREVRVARSDELKDQKSKKII